jgi:hypothetical protein
MAQHSTASHSIPALGCPATICSIDFLRLKSELDVSTSSRQTPAAACLERHDFRIGATQHDVRSYYLHTHGVTDMIHDPNSIGAMFIGVFASGW